MSESATVTPGGEFVAALRSPAATRLAEALFRRSTLVAASLLVLLLALLFGVLIAQSREIWERIGITEFLFGDVWAPSYVDPATGQMRVRLGALPMVAGTVISSVIALLIAAPVGVLVAIFLVEFAPPRVGLVLTFVVELIAAIPSVVVGLWALYLFAPFLRDTLQWYLASTLGQVIPFFREDATQPTSYSVFTAGIVLALMITPMVIAVGREVIRSVPRSLREGYVAMGATHWELIWHVLLPTARVGLIAAVMLAFGRAVGETIAVTMVIGNIDQVPGSVFESGQSVASKIALNLGDVSDPLELAGLVGLGVVLLVVTVGLSAVVRLSARRLAVAPSGG